MNNKQCEQCGTEFSGRKNSKYCSKKCRSQAFRGRNVTDKSVTVTDNETDNSKIVTDKSVTVTDNETDITNETDIQDSVTDNQNNVKEGIEMETNDKENQQKDVTVKFTETELKNVDIQANEVGVSRELLIKTKSLMDAPNILQLESKIAALTDECEKQKIELAFLRKLKPSQGSNGVGLHISMSPKQKQFLWEWYLKNVGGEEPDGITPEKIDSILSDSMIDSFITGIENDLIEHENYNVKIFEDNPLVDRYNKLK